MVSVNRIARFVLFAFLSQMMASVAARDLTIGMQSVVTSIDPHYHNTAQNNCLSLHIFDSLIDFELDGKLNLKPSLAVAWKPIDSTTWEFKLRENVKWHDGSPFTAADVEFSIQRAPNVPNSPSSFAVVTRQIKQVKVIDALTLHVATKEPHPLLPRDLSGLRIVSKRAGERATTADYDSGKAAIGTGPYKFAGYAPNVSVTLIRNEHYWNGKEPWDKLTFKFLPNAAARTAALLAGEADVIEGVAPEDGARVKIDDKLALITGQSNRLIFLAMDSSRERSPFVADKAGRPLTGNPLKDVRVRKAISLAINRFSLINSALDGRGNAAGQLMPPGSFGTSVALRPPASDAAQARSLLQQAGYPNGFRITLHGPNDRYVHDAKVAEAVGRMLAEIGIDAKVETMPGAAYFARASKLDFSFMLFGWGGNDVQEGAMVLRSLLMTYSKDKGVGVANRGRYSNARLDGLTDEALSSFQIIKRHALSAKATELAMEDVALIPLYFETGAWAVRKPLTMNARIDQYTLAMTIR